MMAAEEAMVSAGSDRVEDVHKANGSTEVGGGSDSDHKFQSVIAAWRSKYENSIACLTKSLTSPQVLICLHL